MERAEHLKTQYSAWRFNRSFKRRVSTLYVRMYYYRDIFVLMVLLRHSTWGRKRFLTFNRLLWYLIGLCYTYNVISTTEAPQLFYIHEFFNNTLDGHIISYTSVNVRISILRNVFCFSFFDFYWYYWYVELPNHAGNPVLQPKCMRLWYHTYN